jgi:diguanylate cyclase (GGDEF)-like protein
MNQTSPLDLLRVIQESSQALAGAPGIKTLVRRFGEATAKRFGVDRLDCAKISGKGAKLTLKRRKVQIDGVEPFGDDVHARLAAELGKTGGRVAEMKEGLTHLAVGDLNLDVAIIDDPQAKEGTVVFWEARPASSPLDAALLDHLTRVMQGESRWLRKLDRTQAMLYKDDLTGLYNYRYLEIALDDELRRADRFQTQFCLLFIDLDGFKPINDQHGHVAGSSVLKQVAQVLRDAVREIDVPIRYGGDEFVVVLLGASLAKGVLAAERVRRRIEAKEFELEGGATARVTASIGVAAFPDHGRDRETLLKLADETMYDSKRNGKNRVTVAGAERTA